MKLLMNALERKRNTAKRVQEQIVRTEYEDSMQLLKCSKIINKTL